MIVFHGVAYFPYVLFTENGPMQGLDPRPLAEIRKDWLAKAQVGARRIAAQARAVERAQIQNSALYHRRTGGGSDLDLPGDAPTQVSLDEVAGPPALSFEEDEVLVLSGTPDGYGSSAYLAVEVCGVGRMGGRDADDFCGGADVWFATPEDAEEARRGRGPTAVRYGKVDEDKKRKRKGHR